MRAGSQRSTTCPQVTTAGGTREAGRAGRPTAARAAARAQEGRDDELHFFQTHSPPSDPDVAYFSHGGAPVTGDIRERVLHVVGMRTAVRVVAGPQPGAIGAHAAAVALHLAQRGDVDVGCGAHTRHRFLLGLWDPQNRDIRRKSPPQTNLEVGSLSPL